MKVHMSHNADGRDSGAIGAYRISFTKNHADTRLRLFYSDNLRALSGAHDCACKWEILVDGNQCPSVEIFGQAAWSAQSFPHRQTPKAQAPFVRDKDQNNHQFCNDCNVRRQLRFMFAAIMRATCTTPTHTVLAASLGSAME